MGHRGWVNHFFLVVTGGRLVAEVLRIEVVAGDIGVVLTVRLFRVIVV